MASADCPVAVVGVACRLPGAANCLEFWELIDSSADTVGDFPNERSADIEHVTRKLKDQLDCKNPFFTGSFFKTVDQFDESVFGISKKEALYIEPEQRIFLETVYELLEDAGMAGKIRGTRTGVYVGHTVNKYKYILTENHPSISHGNHSPFIASRVSYSFDLHGPAMMVATGCSSSLLAVHLACQGLIGGDCDMAIAGGITLDLLPLNMKTDIWNQLGITGSGVRCRPFDSLANGIAKAEGCGVVFLKRLDHAIRDGDHIYGVLLSTTANQDGRSNGITAPHPLAQADMLTQAWKRANISPDELSYIEAHGTGTLLGDPIEVSGIQTAVKGCLGRDRMASMKPILIQSLKANVGHMADGAAGVMSLLKVLLCLHFEKIPPAVHFKQPNPHIDWKNMPVYVNTESVGWQTSSDSRRTAGVSSFGLLGTNVHVVVREYRLCPSSVESQLHLTGENTAKLPILALSAKTKLSLLALAQRFTAFFADESNECKYGSLRDVFYTLNVSRQHELHLNRLVLVASTWKETAEHLKRLDIHTSIDDRLNEDNIRRLVYTGGVVCRFDISQDNQQISKTDDIICNIVSEYLCGRPLMLNWLYSSSTKQRVPLLPSYCFDRRRFWPDLGKSTTSDSLLNLEHSSVSKDHQLMSPPRDNSESSQCDGAMELLATSDMTPELFLENALNEALGTAMDWKQHQEDNLFSLGIDSLMCVQVISSVKENFGQQITFTMKEFHGNPTFGQLSNLLISKAKQTSSTLTVHECQASEAVTSQSVKMKNEFHVSSAQQRLWVMQQICPCKCTYNCCNGLMITGPLNVTALDKAVKYVTSVNASFHTTFSSNIGSGAANYTELSLKQIIHLDNEYAIKHIYLTEGYDSTVAEQKAINSFTSDYQQAFDLEVGPLARFCLYHISGEQFLFTMVVHHIIYDGSSHFIFWNQLWDIYTRISQNEVVDIVERVVPLYAEIAENEHFLLQTDWTKDDLCYWSRKLSAPLPMTTLCGDKLRPPIFTNNGKRITVFIDKCDITALTDVSHTQHTTFTALLSSILVLLYGFTGQTDMVIGFPVAGRMCAKAKGIIGCFVNTVALRLPVDQNESFKSLMDKVFAECVEIYDHQHVPFDWIVKELATTHSTSVTPIFNVNVTYHNTEIQREHTGPPKELTVDRRLPHNGSAKWDLYFDFLDEPSKGKVRFTLEYYSDLYSDDYADNIVKTYMNLLHELPSYADAAVNTVPVSFASSHLAFSRGNQKFLGSDMLPQLLIDAARVHENRIAISTVADSSDVTYKQLLFYVSKIATILRDKCKLGHGSRVGLLVKNSAESLYAILGASFTGASYIPLDPELPKARLELICNEALVKVIVFNADYLQKANYLRWVCPYIDFSFCIDCTTFDGLVETANNPLMNVDLWNYVADSGQNDVQAGGWKNSYTGDYFSDDEMLEYAENVKEKLGKLVHNNSVILEIGCGSGITTQQLCPLASEYYATDASDNMIKRLEAKLGQRFPQLHIKRIEANETLHSLAFLRGKADLIVLNSVLHCFPGHSYFLHVLNQCIQLLAPGGILFLGDVMDLDKQQLLVGSLTSYKNANPKARTKLDWSNELFLSKTFINNVFCNIKTMERHEVSDKIHTLRNELTAFRFDVTAYKRREPCDDTSIGHIFFALKYLTLYDNKNHMSEEILTSDITSSLQKWARDVSSTDDAYLLYTSGTTGSPKGIVISHGALLNYSVTAADLYGFDAESKVPLFSPLTFDFTLTAIFCTLLKGGSIMLFSPFQDSYGEIATRSDISIAKFSPLQLELILDYNNSDQCHTLKPLSEKTFIIGGEALSAQLLNNLWRRQQNCMFTVWNEYGPTEATVGCIVKKFMEKDFPLTEDALVAIGTPFDNCFAAVVDADMKIVPVGAIGRLGIGGVQLCKKFAGSCTSNLDYRNKCFFSAPVLLRQYMGEEMFLTDDLASMQLSGEFVYHERCSTGLVKINGIRVDLNETKLVLERLCSVKQAWVCLVDNHDNKLVVGAALHMDSPPDDWRDMLKILTLHLPPTAIPKVLVHIGTPHLNKNGKVDMTVIRELLRRSAHADRQRSDETVSDDGTGMEASSTAEKMSVEIQQIWQQMFSSATPPKLDDDFFLHLGGDSLLAIHAVRRMNHRGIAITVTDLFQQSTIRNIVNVICRRETILMQTDNAAHAEEEGWLFSPSFIVEDFFNLRLKQPSWYCLPALLHFKNVFREIGDIVDTALRLVMERHCSLRSTFEVHESVIKEVAQSVDRMFQPSTYVNIQKTGDQKHLMHEAEFSECCNKLERSLSVDHGPIFRCAVIYYDGEIFALLVAHHLVVDIISWTIVLEDFSNALKIANDADVRPNALAKPMMSYPNFCAVLRSTDIFDSQKDYWLNVIRECDGANCGKLKTIPNATEPTFKTAQFVTTDVSIASNPNGSAEHAALLTALAGSLQAEHHQIWTDICLEMNGRDLPGYDTTETVGWCTCRFPFVLKSTREEIESSLSTVPNGGVGYSVLYHDRKLPRIMFVYLGSIGLMTTSFGDTQLEFEYTPWIEVMVNELEKRRFHRYEEEKMEFDAEVIAWRYQDTIKIGILYDCNVLASDAAERILASMQSYFTSGQLMTANTLQIISSLMESHVPHDSGAMEDPRSVLVFPSIEVPTHCMATVNNILKDLSISVNPEVFSADQLITQMLNKSHVISDSTIYIFVLCWNSLDMYHEFAKTFAETRPIRRHCKAVIISIGLPDKNLASEATEILNRLVAAYEQEMLVNLSAADEQQFDSYTFENYNMPLSHFGYFRLAQLIARVVSNTMRQNHFKVICVDADYTLWDGECANGEVHLSDWALQLQRFLQVKKQEGFLLVLVTKNNDSDIRRVFEEHVHAMALKLSDFVLIYANWQEKSENLIAASVSLNLNLDSFVLIDDSRAECLNVCITLPDVCVLQCPNSNSLMTPFIDSLWLLDQLFPSDESRRRTTLYHNELQRHLQLCEDSSRCDNVVRDVDEILASWQMKLTAIDVHFEALHTRACAKVYNRVQELLTRTNQFKINAVHTNIDQDTSCDCIIVSLEDKFGSYGIVSILLYQVSESTLNVIQWVLSCRALSRKVEDAILELLLDKCVTHKLSHLAMNCQRTDRNKPALQFLESQGFMVPTECRQMCELCSISSNKGIRDKPCVKVEIVIDITTFVRIGNKIMECEVPDSTKLSLLAKHDSERSFHEYHEWIESCWTSQQKRQNHRMALYPLLVIQQKTKVPTQKEKKNSGTSTESQLRQLWTVVVGKELEPGMDDDFFYSGGTSFAAVFLTSKIRSLLRVDLHLSDIFTNRTFQALLKVIKEKSPLIDEDILPELDEMESSSRLLTSAEKRMMLLQQLAPDSTAYVETIAIADQWSESSMNAKHFQTLCEKLTSMHPSLTSSISMHQNDSEPFISPSQGAYELNVTCQEASTLEEGIKLVVNSKSTVSLSNLTSFHIVRIQSINTNIFAVHVHHLLADDVSLCYLVKSLRMILDEKNEGAANLADYANYVRWERQQYVMSDEYRRDSLFWKESLSLSWPEISTPGSKILEENIFIASTAASLRQNLDSDMSNSICQFCKGQRVTEFHYFLACFLTVLQRYTASSSLVVAIPVTTRTDAFRDVFGLLVNTLPFLANVDCKKTFNEFLFDISTSWIKSFDHRQYPLDHIVQAVRENHGKDVRLPNVMFNYVIQPDIKGQIFIPSKHAKMQLSLDVCSRNSDRTFEVVMEYASCSVDDTIASRFLNSFLTVCRSALCHSEDTLAELEVLSADELNLLQAFERGHDASAQNVDTHIHPLSMFQHNVQAHPEKTAVVCGDRRISYISLDRMSTKVAVHLSSTVTSDVLCRQPVVIAMDKDETTIAAAFGVWKAGGYFLPVSSVTIVKLPELIDKCCPAAILTNFTDKQLNVLKMIGKSTPLLTLSQCLQVEVQTHFTPQGETAYVMYTSGSTGEPKQCKIASRSLSCVAQAWKTEFKLDSFPVRILQWAPFCFDVFVGDVVKALLSTCGKLIICPENQRLDIDSVIDIMDREKITVMEVTPQFALQLTEYSTFQRAACSLKLFVIGSDVMKCNAFRKLKETLCNARVINSYGMTEATIDSSYYDGPCQDTLTGTVPIGKPLPGTELHIIDYQTDLPVPIGTAGELCIGGTTVATGPINTVDLGNGWGRVLRTGDLARWMSCGNIEHMGRLDGTRKLRGFRINTNEIEEKVKLVTPEAKWVYVTVVNCENNDSLCAYVVLKNPEKDVLDVKAVKKRLAEVLPAYSLPEFMCSIETIPLNSNGKVNHKQLPTRAELRRPVDYYGQNEECDQTPITKELCQLLAQVLGYADPLSISIHSTFMEQGAHSLALLRFAAMIHNNLSIPMAVSTLFSYPSIELLSLHLKTESRFPEDRRLEQCDGSVDVSKRDEEICEMAANDSGGHIAIVGIGLRLPGNTTSLHEFWETVLSGTDVIGKFPYNRAADVLNCAPYYMKSELQNNDVFEGAFLENIDLFDHEFFGLAPNEAKFMAPEQRLFLTVATEALLDAGLLTTVNGSNVGVFVGASEIGYSKLVKSDEAVCVGGELPAIIASRVAYQYNLKGPTMMIDTACSSSLVALQTACESVRRGECEGALVGGVNLILYPGKVGVYGVNGIMSPDFKCRSFDRNANGTVAGEGVICLMIKPLEAAKRDGNGIYGVIAGYASNSVGKGNGITAPSSTSQEAVIRTALKSASYDPKHVSYIEAHGTGTKLGDGIELAALSAVFSNTCVAVPIGSVKASFGHLDAAAGLLGVLKILAQFKYEMLPSQVNFGCPNSELQASRLRVVQLEETWKKVPDAQKLIAGVSSFGLSGTNCHVILEEPPVYTTRRFLACDSERKIPLFLAFKHSQQLVTCSRVLLNFIVSNGKNPNPCTFNTFLAKVAQKSKDMLKAQIHMNKTARPTAMCLMPIEANTFDSLRNIIDRLMINVQNFVDENHFGIVTQDALDVIPDCCENYVGIYLPFEHPQRHWLDYNSFKTNVVGRRSREDSQLKLDEILASKMAETRELARSLQFSPTDEFHATLDQFCTCIITKCLASTPLISRWKKAAELTLDDAFTFTRMHLRYRKLFFVMIRHLELCRVIEKKCDQPHSFEVLRPLDDFVDSDLDALAHKAAHLFPSYGDCFMFPLHCFKHYPDVLTGKMDPLSVIYPKGDLNFMYRFNKLGDILGDIYYNMYMQLIAEYVQLLTHRCHGVVRILEVGAGVGHVTKQLIPKLKTLQNVEYWFTDLGKAFVNNAKSLFADYSDLMRYAVFDITKPAAEQGLHGSFDIIISYNVIHTTESIRQSVANLQATLNEHGTLFIVESSRNETWSTLAWGLLDGWWFFKDYDLRPHDPMLDHCTWKKILEEANFAAVFVCPVFPEEEEHVEKFLYICTNDGSQKSDTDSLYIRGWWETGINASATAEDRSVISCHPATPRELGNENDVLHAVISIWKEVLGVSDIKPTDEFNALGGESLLAIQMMEAIRKKIGFQLEIADTFAYPSPKLLAKYIYEEITDSAAAVVADAPCVDKTEHELTEIHERRETMLMFPGQGAQKEGMCRSMIGHIGAEDLFHKASDILGYNFELAHLCSDETIRESMKSTEFVQVLLFVSCLAKVEQLKDTEPDLLQSISVAAGLSVGEVAALVFAGAINFCDGLKFVQARGKVMEEEVGRYPTGMVSIFGPDVKQLENFINSHFPDSEISTYLGDNQHCVAATTKQCEEMVSALLGMHKDELHVIDARILRVAGAFHSSYMKVAADRLSDSLNKLTIRTPKMPVILNYSGKATRDPAVIKEQLGKQLYAPVMWRNSIIEAFKSGVRHFVEVSPSRVLSSIVPGRIECCKNQGCTQRWIQI